MPTAQIAATTSRPSKTSIAIIFVPCSGRRAKARARIAHPLQHTLDMPHKKVALAAMLTLSALPTTALDDRLASTPRWSPPASLTPGAKSRPAARAGLPDISSTARQMERLAEQLMQQKKLPGLAMAIVQDGKVLSMRGYGRT